jgi:hypothetical protein
MVFLSFQLDHPVTATLSVEEAGDIVVEETKSRMAISWAP